MSDAERFLDKAVLRYEDETYVCGPADYTEMTMLALFSIAESLGTIAMILDRVEGAGDDKEPFLRVRSSIWETRRER